MYVVSSIVRGVPSFIHVTVVAGEPVEVQVRVVVEGLKVSLVMMGGSREGMKVIVIRDHDYLQ